MSCVNGEVDPALRELVRQHRASQGLAMTCTPEQRAVIEAVLDREIHRRAWSANRADSPNRADRGYR